MGYWLAGATVVDGQGGEPIGDTTVQVEDGRIASLGERPSGGEEIIDAAGLTLTPGLIDAHVHLGLSSDLAAMQNDELSVAELAADMFENCRTTVGAGFTTVRDVGGIDGGLAKVVADGKVLGPRILPSGPLHCQTGGHGHLAAVWEPTGDYYGRHVPGLLAFSFLSDGPDEMRKNVREGFRRGAKFLKLCVTGGVVSTHDELTDTQFTVEEISVAVQEASARGTYVTVHAHNKEGIVNAIAAGVKCIEHGSGIDQEIAELMAANGVALVPTLSVVDRIAQSSSAAVMFPEAAGRAALVRDHQIAGLLAARVAGVRVGSGSDRIGRDQGDRGFELVLRAELETPMDALVAATRVNADILGLGDQIGTVEVGKRADLVLFDGNPLDDPSLFNELSKIALVIKDGQIVQDRR
ncbi:amidohydrolase family protein [Aeromicrobium sp. P5_D10]